MEIRDDSTGCFVRLTPINYQFPRRGDPYDDNWLIIKGRVQGRTGAWTFQEPALLVDEAQSISAWLRRVAQGCAVPMEMNADGTLEPTLEMIEPVINVGLVASTSGVATVRFFLQLEAAPNSSSMPHMDYFLDLTTDLVTLELAAAEWDTQLAQFPRR